MRGFLGNLVKRHQGRGEQVTPRPRGHFEAAGTRSGDDSGADTGTGTARQPESSGTGPAMADRHTPQARPPLAEPGTAAAAPPEPIGSELNPANERLQPDSPSRLEMRQPTESEITAHSGVAGVEAPRFIGGQEQDQSAPEPASPQAAELTPAADLSQRIEEVLARLSSVTAAGQAADDPVVDSARIDAPPVVAEPAPPARSRHADTAPANAVNPAPQPAQEKEIEQPRMTSMDEFTIPGWLSELRADLAQRSSTAEQQQEPVINVTIGRVEVRSSGKPQPPRTPAKKKPSGVMSLDEYLKQRQSGASS